MSKKAAYLFVHKDYPIDLHGVNSGAETATLALARALAQSGERVVVACYIKGGREELISGVQFWDLGADFDVARIIERARELGRYRLLASCRGAALLCARHEQSCISRHFIAHDPSAGAIGMKAEVLCRLVDSVICVSEAQKALFVKEGGDATKIQVVPNGADRSIFAPAPFAERALNRIVFAGALVTDKGVDILIRAFQYVRHEIPTAELHVYGSAAMWGREPLFNPDEVAKAIPGITFFGGVPQQQVAQAFSTAAVNVIPSRWFDSFPLTAVEAQSTGCPIIAFDTGGIKEAFIPGKTGILVSPIEEKPLAQALIGLLSNPQRIAEMSANALELVAQRFSWDRIAAQIVALCESAPVRATPPTSSSGTQSKPCRVGVLSTWNQECGLATYAKFLFSEFPKDSVVVFAEQNQDRRTATDEPFVTRCWNRASSDFSALLAAVRREQISLLHINPQGARFFTDSAAFGAFLKAVRNDGVEVVTHVHSTFTADPAFAALTTATSVFVAHTDQNRLELIANGARPEQVVVIPHGVAVNPVTISERRTAREALSLSEGETAVVGFGFVQPHKGTEGVLEIVAKLIQTGGSARGFIVGMANPSDANGAQYLAQLKDAALQLRIADRITFLDRFVSDSESAQYLAAADLVLMNYRTGHYEASGACSVAIGRSAVGSSAVVLTSGAPPFIPFGDAVWHLTSGYPPALAAKLLVTTPSLREELQRNAVRFAQQHSWSAIATQVQALYRERFQLAPAAIPRPQPVVSPTASTSAPATKSTPRARVLLQNRPNTFTQRGGDTIVIEHTVRELERLGVEVTVDVELTKNPAGFDLVHLFNFALPDMVRALGERAKNAGVPFVVTTLYEDVPSFHRQGLGAAEVLINYVRRQQDPAFWSALNGAWEKVEPAKRFQNDWVAQHAAALLTNGLRESETIKRDYPNCGAVREVELGFEVGAAGDPSLFIREYGVRDFVFCVGRLESRKNQLMLLKALEHSELPVVIAGSGFTYQPEYAEAVRNFKRAGKTLVLDRLSPEMLASAYAAARVHALPSWYELPGLVTLEAAAQGCAVVATDKGTIRDYLGELVFYCEPGNEQSIRSAVERAHREGAPKGLRERVAQFKWCEIGNRTIKVYEDVLRRDLRGSINEGDTMATTQQTSGSSAQSGAAVFGSYDLAPDVTEFQELLERAETHAKANELDKSQEFLEKAENLNPNSARHLQVRGTVFLAQGLTARAQSYFERARSINPTDARVICGLGMCELRKSSPKTAYDLFVQAIALEPTSSVALMQLVACAYAIGRFDDLERILTTVTKQNPTDTEMKYCLAGVYLKTSRSADAARLAREILASKPDHVRAKELLTLADASSATAVVAAPVAATPSVSASSVSSSGMTLPTGTIQTRPVSASLPSLEKIPTASSTTNSSALTSAMGKVGTMIPTSTSAAIDLELGALEERKRAKEYAEVLADLEKLLSRQDLVMEQRETATCIKAEILVLQNQAEAAEKLYMAAIERNPASARALSGRAVVAANQNRWDDAQRLFERAHAIKPSYDLALAGLGLCAWQRGDLNSAWDRFSQALQSNPENVRALLGLVQIGYPLKRFAEVEVAIRAYVELHPADLEWVYSLAGCLFAQNKLDEAMEQVNQITLFKPEDARANELRTMIESRTGAAHAG